ncbi:MAG: hypothetical protein VX255_03560 [Candidatus Latescibacterota bacterium]|nr:hypothetical protein [Candidatus Latescibacterota bacterium]
MVIPEQLAGTIALQWQGLLSRPAYPMLLAGGAVAIEGFLTRRGAHRSMVAIPLIVVIGSLGTIPIAIPILSVDATIAYGKFGTKFPGMEEAMRWEDGSFHDLPQAYADMLGRQEQAEAVARVYREIGHADVAGKETHHRRWKSRPPTLPRVAQRATDRLPGSIPAANRAS